MPSKTGRFGTGAQATIVVAVVALLAAAPSGPAFGSMGTWTSTTSYPIQVAGDSCVTYSNYIYCVGGFDVKGNDYDNTYYAPLSASGVGSWTQTTSYPAAVDSAACTTNGPTIYCVGGENSTSVLSNVYTATLSSSGIGKWSSAGAYPQTIAASACFVYSGVIFCVGGFDITGDETASSYYASLSGGLSSWVGTTSYPFAINSESCNLQGDTVYCVAGNEESGLPQFPIDNVFYAQVSSTGIGQWTTSTAYPEPLSSVACTIYTSSLYCAGGFNLNELSSDQVYTANITSSGVSSWTNATVYPHPFDVASCVQDYSDMYCVAGRTFLGGSNLSTSNAVYYATLGTPATTNSTTTTTSLSSSSSSTSSTSAPPSSTASTSSTPTTSPSSSSSSLSSTSTVPEFNALALFVAMLASAAAVGALSRRSRSPG